ncbi:MAG: hypothetical protein ACJ74O_09840 [Frankiaceae bacterium]
MGSKNKGGRETRKPKQDKKLKGSAASAPIIPPSPHGSTARPAK